MTFYESLELTVLWLQHPAVYELSCPFGNDSKSEQVGHGVIVPATQETEAGGSCEPTWATL